MITVVVLLFALGIWFILAFLLEKIRAWRYAKFPTADGVITSLTLDEKKGMTRSPSWVPRVEYSFQVSQKVFTASRFTFSRVVVDEKTAKRINDLFAVGNPVKVYFNPRNPQDCVLNPSGADLKTRLVLGVALTLIGLVIWLISIAP
jgi:hypothetical protein